MEFLAQLNRDLRDIYMKGGTISRVIHIDVQNSLVFLLLKFLDGLYGQFLKTFSCRKGHARPIFQFYQQNFYAPIVNPQTYLCIYT